MKDIQGFYATLAANIEAPEHVVSFPSMMTDDEKVLLYRLARSYYTGIGTIVDVGLFLGASTNAFASGIKDNTNVYPSVLSRKIHPIHAYDIALWNPGFDKYLSTPAACQALAGQVYKGGDNYFPLLQRLLAPHAQLIDFRIGDIVKTASATEPIEIAFYDCLKTYDRDLAVFKAFAPHYTPGRTIVIQQDYFYEDAVESKLRQEILSPHFEFLGSVASSAVFRLVKPIPTDFFDDDPVAFLSVDDSIDLLDRASRRIAPSAHRLCAELGTIRFMIRNDRLGEAEHRLSDIDARIGQTKLPPRPALVARSARALLNHQKLVG